jgi:hypothetical protein
MAGESERHEAHGWEQRSTDHIRNVAYLLTHRLMSCPCGFYGWVPLKEAP